tara:strand:- start:11601 stop:12137 length:537 start_codon:yes stop_codon:yes gene_type:complete
MVPQFKLIHRFIFMLSSSPNLLLITTDQQRGDCLGCAGHPVVETPYIDELASNGVYMPFAYSSVPSCTPARAAIITGMDQWIHGRLTITMAGNDALEYPATLPGECVDLSKDPVKSDRVSFWRGRLAEINEKRGDPRGSGGRLVEQPEGAMILSPNYQKWKDRAFEKESNLRQKDTVL